jgi:hypothetical protein
MQSIATVEQDRIVWENKLTIAPRNLVQGDGPFAGEFMRLMQVVAVAPTALLRCCIAACALALLRCWAAALLHCCVAALRAGYTHALLALSPPRAISVRLVPFARALSLSLIASSYLRALFLSVLRSRCAMIGD